MKMDYDGKMIWVKQSFASMNSLLIDNDDNLLILGMFKGGVDFNFCNNASSLSSNGNNDIYLLKIDRFSKQLVEICREGAVIILVI